MMIGVGYLIITTEDGISEPEVDGCFTDADDMDIALEELLAKFGCKTVEEVYHIHRKSITPVKVPILEAGYMSKRKRGDATPE